MSETRLMKLLEGQSSTANKIFRFVPIQEAWDSQEIHRAAMVAGVTTVTSHAIRRGLGELSDAGAIREPRPGYFQRDAVTPKQNQERDKMAKPAAKPKTTQEQPAGTLDVLASLSADVISLGEEMGKRLKVLAARIDDAALAVEAEREANAEASSELRQLQAMLKKLAGV